MNIPNAFTLLRILLVPVFLIGIIYGRLDVAFGIFVFAALTDFFDGYLARRLDQKTPLGAFLDPLADKLLLSVAFVALAITGDLPAWLAVLVVSRDLFISLGFLVVQLFGKKTDVIATVGGKLATFLEMATIGLTLLVAWLAPAASLPGAVFSVTGAVAALSGLHYLLQGARALPTGTNRPKGASGSREIP